MLTIRSLLLASFMCVLPAASAAAQCPEWTPGFHRSGPDGPVLTQLVDRSAAGQRLLVGGDFASIDGLDARRVAAFDGVSWTTFGEGPSGAARALAVYDDGTGSALYAGGAGFLERWDGTAWTSVGVSSGWVYALSTHDDGNGPALFVGGWALTVGALDSRKLLRYDGAWTDVENGAGLAGASRVQSLEVHDDGSGAALYVGGTFAEIGGTPASRLASWDGQSFTGPDPSGSTLGRYGSINGISALRSVTSPGSAAVLHVGGRLAASNSNQSSWLIWDQGTWFEVGENGAVEDFVARREAGGVAVYAARARSVDRLVGASLTSLPLPNDRPVISLSSFGAAGSEILRAGSSMPVVEGSYLMERQGAQWTASPGGLGLPGVVLETVVHDFGGGDELVAMHTNELGARVVVRLDGGAWSEVGTATPWSYFSRSLESHAGSLFGAGFRTDATQYAAGHFNGSDWVPVGDPLQPLDIPTMVASVDIGQGPELYAGGEFFTLGQPGTAGIGRWDGNDWVSVGGGVDTAGQVFTTVASVLPWDDGTGAAMYAGGFFVGIGGVPANNIARWDGQQWSPLGQGIELNGAAPSGAIQAMTLFNSPAGEQLIVAGVFDHAGGQPAGSIAAWDGTQWTSLGAGLTLQGSLGIVERLLAFDIDGEGEKLYALGNFDTAGIMPVQRLAVWNGTQWAAFVPITGQAGGTALLFDLLEADLGEGRGMYLSGAFRSIEGVPSKSIARWSDPCAQQLGIPYCASRVNSSGRRALTRVSGSSSVSSLGMSITLTGAPAGTASLVFTGTEESRGPIGDGILCVGGALQRVVPVGLTDTSGRRTQTYDFGAPYAAGSLAGTTLYAQSFFRDAAAGMSGLGTSDAVRVTLTP